MGLPAGFVEVRSRREVVWVRADLAALGTELLWREPEPVPAAKGRGGAGALRLGVIEAFVRPFRRGGALRRLLGDRYSAPTRACQELEVLERLRQDGVPVVAPLAALARRKGTFWRLRLITERVPDALPLPAFCAADPSARRWAIEAAGVAVRLAFANGLVHEDLHPDNVLVVRHGDKVRAVLVDLDKATLVKSLTTAQKDEMLVRMARYVDKHKKRFASPFSRADHLRFLVGLGLDRAARAEEVERLWPMLRRALRLRGRTRKKR